MGIQVTIGAAATDRTAKVRMDSIEIKNTIVSNSDTMDLIAVSTGDWRPQAANEIIISTSSDGTRHFAGMIIDVVEEQDNPSQFRYRCAAKDYTYLFDRQMVAATYPSQNADATVASIVKTYSTGFSTGNITSPSPSIAAQRYDYVYPSDAIRAIADQLQWVWYIDYSKNVYFVPQQTFAPPVATVNLDTDLTTFGNVVLRESASQIKNRIIVDGYDVAATVNNQATYVGNGNQRFFPLGQSPNGNTAGGPTSTQMTVTLNGTALALAWDFVGGAPATSGIGAVGSSGTFFVCQDNMGGRMDYTPTSTETLVVTFQYLKPGGIQQDDASAQTQMASREGGDGIHYFRVQDPQLRNYTNSDDLAIALGAKLTQRYGQPKIQGEASSFVQGWKAGQTFTLSTTKRWAGGFTKTMYVHQVIKRWVNHPSTGGSPTFRFQVNFGETWLPL